MDAKKVAPKVNGQLRPYYLIQRARKVNIQHLLLVQKQKLPINVSDFLLLSAVYLKTQSLVLENKLCTQLGCAHARVHVMVSSVLNCSLSLQP